MTTEIETEETLNTETETPSKKAISLRVATDDLDLAKDLASDLNIGYQTLLNQIIHDGLLDKQHQLRYEKLVTTIRASLPELKAAQDLLETPAVKAAKDLLENPAVRAAQQLVDHPATKAASQFADQVAHNPTFVQLKGAYDRAAGDLQNSALARAIKDLAENPAVKAASELAESTQAKLQRDLHDTPVGRLSRELEELKTALKQANLLK